MPAWYHGDERAAPASELAEAVLAGVEADRRSVAYPREVRLLALNAVAPGLVDALLRRLRVPRGAAARCRGNVTAAGARRSSGALHRDAPRRRAPPRAAAAAPRRASPPPSMNARVAGDRCALRRVMKANVSYSGGSNGTP